MREMRCKCGYNKLFSDYNYCPVCRIELRKSELFKECINPECRHILKQDEEICPDCRHSQKVLYKKGDIIKFGEYFINSESKKDKIEWIVLEDMEDSFLLLSKYLLDSMQYNETKYHIDWNSSMIKKEMNETFLNKAFTDKEKEKLKDNGNGRIFCLSEEEVLKYLSKQERKADLTTYLKNKDEDAIYYWLRDKNLTNNFASVINDDGEIKTMAKIINQNNAIRPAILLSK